MLSWGCCTRPATSMLCISWSASGHHVTSSRDAIRCQGAFRESWTWTKPLAICSCPAFLFSAAKKPSGLVYVSRPVVSWFAGLWTWHSRLNIEPWCPRDPSFCMTRNRAPQEVSLVTSESWPECCEYPHIPAEQGVIGGPHGPSVSHPSSLLSSVGQLFGSSKHSMYTE